MEGPKPLGVHEYVKGRDEYGLTPLHRSTGSPDAVLALCTEHRADPNLTDKNGNTPLHFVTADAEDSAAAVVDVLLNSGAVIDARNNRGKTPLHLACIRLQLPVIRHLLQRGANTQLRDVYDATALHYATLYQDIQPYYKSYGRLTTELERRAAGTPYATARENMHAQNMLGKIRVRGYADECRNEDQLDYLSDRVLSLDLSPLEPRNPYPNPGGQIHIEIIRDIMDHMAEVNAKDRHGRSALMIACVLGFTDVAKLLIDRGADVFDGDNFQSSVLHEVVSSGSESMVRLVLSWHGKEPRLVNMRTLKGGETPLHVAVRTNFSDAIDLLLKHGSDINSTDSTGNSPLHTAVQHLQVNATTKVVSAAGADLNAPNNVGNTPLHCAIVSGENDVNRIIIRLLIDAGVDLSVKNFVGRTVLHRAIWFRFEDVVTDLLNAGADVNAIDDYGNTPLHMIDRMTVELARILQDHGADMNARNAHGLTPLHLACLTRKRSLIPHLLNSGADCNVQDSFGATPLHYSVHRQERFVAGSSRTYDALIKPLLDNKDSDWAVHTKVGGRTALHLASMNTDIQRNIIRILARMTGDSSFDNLGNSYLHYLGEYCGVPNKGDNVISLGMCRHKNKCGQTPLHVHAKAGFSHWARTFPPDHLQEDKDNLGRTYLHFYCSSAPSDRDLGHSIQNMGTEKDFVGRNCLHHVCIANRPTFGSWMGAQQLINTRDKFGRTPLFYAALYQIPEFTEQLVSTGADPSIVDHDVISPMEISMAAFSSESPTSSRVVVKRYNEHGIPEWVTGGSDRVEATDNWVYNEWLSLHRGRGDDRYNNQLLKEVRAFAAKLMAKVAELDCTFQSEPTLVGSSHEGTRAKLHDEFDFMVVLNNFERLEDVGVTHERFPGYVRFKATKHTDQFRKFCDKEFVVQPIFVKDRLYSLLIEASSYPDVWEGGVFEYLKTRLQTNLHSPAVTMKSTLNRLRVEDKLYFYRETEVSIDFVPAVPTRLRFSPASPFGRYVANSLPDTDSRAFAVMKPHKYTVGNDGNGFCPTNFIILEAETVRRSPATVRAAYVLMKHLLFCKRPQPVDVNKYSVKQCVLHSIVTNEFERNHPELDVVTPEGLVACVRVLMRRIWECATDDSVTSVYDAGILLPFWEFEPFPGFLKVYFDSCGILYTSDVCDFDDTDLSYFKTSTPSDMQRTSARLISDKAKSVVEKFRASYDRIRRLGSILRLREPVSDDKRSSVGVRCGEDGENNKPSQRESRLRRYALMFDDSTNDLYVNEITRTLLTPSPYCIGVPRNNVPPIVRVTPEDAAAIFRRIYRRE